VRPTDPAFRSDGSSDEIGTVEIAKAGGGIRTLNVLGPRDLRRYEAAVAAVVPAVERSLGDVAVANRSRPVAAGLRLEPWSRARDRYLRRIAAAAKGPIRAAFVGDVRDCYGSITHVEVVRALRRLGVLEVEVNAIVEALRGFEERGVRGLPVGPQPSAVLANAVLAPVDRAVAGAVDGPVLRWVDDVVAFATDGQGARRAADVFGQTLVELGLAPHEGKSMTIDDPRALRSAGARPSGSRAADVT
jgi:hypothetical protein